MGAADGGKMIAHRLHGLCPTGRTFRIFAASAVAVAGVGLAAASSPPRQARSSAALHRTAAPLRFQARATASDPIKYSADGANYTLYLANEEADVVLHGDTAPAGQVARGQLIVVRAYAAVLRMRFVDSNLPTSVEPHGTRDGARLPCTAVAYRGIYPGTDVILRGDQQGLGFELSLSPGSGSDRIVLDLGGATAIALDDNGNAVVHAGNASFTLQRPSVILRSGSITQRISGSYRIESRNRLRFIVGAPVANPQSVTD